MKLHFDKKVVKTFEFAGIVYTDEIKINFEEGLIFAVKAVVKVEDLTVRVYLKDEPFGEDFEYIIECCAGQIKNSLVFYLIEPGKTLGRGNDIVKMRIAHLEKEPIPIIFSYVKTYLREG